MTIHAQAEAFYTSLQQNKELFAALSQLAKKGEVDLHQIITEYIAQNPRYSASMVISSVERKLNCIILRSMCGKFKKA